MTLTQIKPAGLSKPVDLADNEKIRLGTGNDLQIYHDGSNSYLAESGTGSLVLASNGSGIWFQKDVSSSENLAIFRTDGACELNYNNSKKFETTDIGTRTTGVLQVTDATSADAGNRISVGTSQDIRIYHIATADSYIRNYTGDFYLQGSNSGTIVNNIKFEYSTGATEIYYDGSKKFETTSNGISVTGSVIPTGNVNLGDSSNSNNNRFIAGASDDLQIYHDGTDSHIQNTQNSGELKIRSHQTDIKNADNNETQAIFHENAAVELYYDNSKKFETTSGGATVSGSLIATANVEAQNNMHVADNKKFLVGNGNDLQIFHDGSSSYLSNRTGNLYIEAKSGQTAIQIIPDGAVDLRHNGSKKFQTLSNGCEVLGRLGVGDGTDPETTFQVTATAAGAQYPVLLKNRTNGDAAVGIRFIASGADLSDGDFASIEAGHGASLTTNHEFRFKTCHSGTVAEKLRIRSSGGITFNGDSAEANALDDYEEGTFTPTLIYQNTTGLTLATNSAAGKYTKIGNICYVVGYMNWSVTGSPINDNVGFGGLPFSTHTGQITAGSTRFIWNVTLGNTSAQNVTHQMFPYGTNACALGLESEQGNRANELGGNSNMTARWQGWYFTA